MVPLHFHFTFEATEAQREMKKLMKPDLYISSKTGPMLKQNEAEYVFPFLFIYICICVTVQGAFVFYYLFILTTPHGMCDLSSSQGIEPTSLALEAWSFNHWVAGKYVFR